MMLQTEEYSLPEGKENRWPLSSPNSPYLLNCKSKSEEGVNDQQPLLSFNYKKGKAEEERASPDKDSATKTVVSEEIETRPQSPHQTTIMNQEKPPLLLNESRSEGSEADTKECSSRKQSQSEPFPKEVLPYQSYQPVMLSRLTMIRQGQYSRNRIYLYGWMRRQCQKFKLQYQTFANAAALMDEYYKYMPFEKEHFIMTALCFVIISSKTFETKVLFTSAVAEANKYNYGQMLKLEEDVLIFFEFQVASYNFARLCGEYMRRWDDALKKITPFPRSCMFFQPVESSYLQYMKTLSLCENQMRYKGSILQTAIKQILHFVLLPTCPPEVEAEAVLDRIFGEPCHETSLECLFAYDIKQETEAEMKSSLEGWQKEFQGKPESDARKAFKKYEEGKQNYKCYGGFLAMLQP